jgi:uncharacterized protein
MAVVDSYAPGRFCWVDLGTGDAADAKRFYAGLFGWTCEDRALGDGAAYTMLLLRGKSVAALYQLEAQQQATGVPPSWLSYIAVASADRAAERTPSLGGTVVMEPFDVLDVGRMAIVQDPTGGIVAIWEARTHQGAELMHEPNSLCWNELATTDVAGAGAFYEGLLGWGLDRRHQGETGYVVFRQGEHMTGGMRAIRPEWGAVPPHWLVYFSVEDCDATLARAERLGGVVESPPADISGIGRCAILCDPQGARFAVIRSTTP